MPNIHILSSHSNPGLSAPINHQAYAQRHGYRYTFDATPYPLANPYDQKLHAIIGALRGWGAASGDGVDDWLVWIDDDAYFMQMESPLEAFLPSEGRLIAVCRSPINEGGEWSAINSGVMLIRRSPEVIGLFEAALATDFELVRKWWTPGEHGPVMIEGGDQERLLYQIEQQGLAPLVEFHDAERFNARVYHFTEAADQHFVCHMASHRTKEDPIGLMRSRFGLNQYLLKGAGPDHRWSMFSDPIGVLPHARTPLRAKARKLAARGVRRVLPRTA